MEDVSSRIVKKAIGLGCQDAIADVITNRSYQIRFAQNEAVIGNRWREATASVFFVYDKRVLASDIKDLTQLDAAVERLVKIAKSSQKNPDYAGIAKGPFRYARVRPDPKVLSLDEGGKYVEAAIGGATDQGAKECAGSDRKSTRLNSSHRTISYAVFCLIEPRTPASYTLSLHDALPICLVKIAKSSQKNPDYAGIAKGPFRYARVRPDPKVLSLDEGGKYVEAAIGGATDQGAKECAGSFWKYEDEHFLATSNGVEAHDHRAS